MKQNSKILKPETPKITLETKLKTTPKQTLKFETPKQTLKPETPKKPETKSKTLKSETPETTYKTKPKTTPKQALKPETKIEIKVGSKKLEKLRKDFDELRYTFSNKDEIKDYRTAF